jgi:hypothetical protein
VKYCIFIINIRAAAIGLAFIVALSPVASMAGALPSSGITFSIKRKAPVSRRF